jgi:hypothetical protein
MIASVWHEPGQPINRLPAYAGFGLAAHLAKEGVNRFSGQQEDLSTNGT